MKYPNRIMIVGNGGRECALANALLLSPEVDEVVLTGPNWGVVDPLADAGKPHRARVLALKATDTEALTAAAQEAGSDLVIIGPEAPLAAGLADELRAAGIATLGPGREASRLESSKLYAKEFMRHHGIPTAAYGVFTAADTLIQHARRLEGPAVLKADGLAAGKGVIICRTAEQAVAAANRLMVEREFGSAADTVLVEELLTGPEISFTCLISGGEGRLLAASTDYKRLRDGDHGPNTGGMGNICPSPYAGNEVTREFNERILQPFLAGLKADGLDYRGFLFVGTMLTADGLKVLEFNVRLGDPEAQVVLPMIAADWPAVFHAASQGKLDEVEFERRPGACVAVVAASGDYPAGKSEPAEIVGLDRVWKRGLLKHDPDEPLKPAPAGIIFAGVGRDPLPPDGSYANYYAEIGDAKFLATGGRVLAACATGNDLSSARRVAYEVLGNLRFEGMQHRSDIGKLR